ncbi:hypothetical protein D3C72_344390 [compost metagenome]
MRYITRDDLNTDSFDRFIQESTGDITNTLDKTEERAIAITATYLSAYDTDSVFGIPIDPEEEDSEYTPGIRHELLVEIISKITLHKIFSRNAARKVPEDIKEAYNWAMNELRRIQSGATPLKGLPPALDEEGTPVSNSMWGNNTNTDFYI